MRRSINIASINVAPWSGKELKEGATVSIFQDGRFLEKYVKEFVDISLRATYSDLTLMEGFWCGLDDETRCVMLRGDPCWTLEKYINFAL